MTIATDILAELKRLNERIDRLAESIEISVQQQATACGVYPPGTKPAAFIQSGIPESLANRLSDLMRKHELWVDEIDNGFGVCFVRLDWPRQLPEVQVRLPRSHIDEDELQCANRELDQLEEAAKWFRGEQPVYTANPPPVIGEVPK